jgi:hypothetical protein
MDAVLETRAAEREELELARQRVTECLTNEPRSFEEFLTAVLEATGPIQVSAIKAAIWEAIERKDAELLSGFRIRRRTQ